MAVPHCAESMILPFQVTRTFWMNHAGIVWPCASLRCPVSISWLINTLTSVESPSVVARIFIGSAMSSSATAQGYFNVLHGNVILAVGFDQSIDVRALRHLYARRDRRFRAGGDIEYGSQQVRVFFDQDCDRLGLRDIAGDADRHHGAVLGDFRGPEKNDVLALCRIAASECLHGVSQTVGVERGLVPRLCLRQRFFRLEPPRRQKQAEERRSPA